MKFPQKTNKKSSSKKLAEKKAREAAVAVDCRALKFN
jgi:hypothetical protein